MDSNCFHKLFLLLVIVIQKFLRVVIIFYVCEIFNRNFKHVILRRDIYTFLVVVCLFCVRTKFTRKDVERYEIPSILLDCFSSFFVEFFGSALAWV